MSGNPLAAMKYKGSPVPKGIPGISMGDGGKKGSTPPKIMKGARSAGAMYKSPGSITRQGKNAKDESSGQSNPTQGSQRDKVKYNQAKQPAQFSNLDNGGMKATRFVC